MKPPAVPGDVVHHEGPGGPPVVGPGDGPESLLTGRVPDLQLHLLTVDLHDPRPKLHPDGVRTVGHDCEHTTHAVTTAAAISPFIDQRIDRKCICYFLSHLNI